MRKARVDDNQAELVKIMRDLGASVTITSNVHDGFPDVVVGVCGVTVLVEIKDGSKPPSRRKLTPKQIIFHNEFRGAKTVIKNVEEALDLVQNMRRAGLLLDAKKMSFW